MSRFLKFPAKITRLDSRMRDTALTMIAITSLVSISCGPPLSPRIEVIDEAQREAYAAFWWNCVIVKSVDLTSACPSTCKETPAAANACSAGAADAQNQIAELEKKYGPERTQEILSTRVGEDGGHSHITPFFPYGPTSGTSPD